MTTHIRAPRHFPHVLLALLLVIALAVGLRIYHVLQLRGVLPGALRGHERIVDLARERFERVDRTESALWVVLEGGSAREPGPRRIGVHEERWRSLRVGQAVDVVRLPGDPTPVLRFGEEVDDGGLGVPILFLALSIAGMLWAGHLFADPNRTAARPLYDGDLGLAPDPDRTDLAEAPPIRRHAEPEAPAAPRAGEVASALPAPDPEAPSPPEPRRPSRMDRYLADVDAPHPDSTAAAIAVAALGPCFASFVWLALHPSIGGLKGVYEAFKYFVLPLTFLLGVVVGPIAVRLRWTFRRRHRRVLPLVCTVLAFLLGFCVVMAFDRWLPSVVEPPSIWVTMAGSTLSGYLVGLQMTPDQGAVPQ